MSNELVRRVANESTLARWGEPAVVRQARAVRDEVQLAEYKASGAMALAAKVMQGVVELDQMRQQLSSGDPVTSAMLADFEAIAFQKVKNIQRGLYGDFGL